MPVEFVQNTLEVDVKKTTKDFTALIGKLSKLTHIEEETFGVEDWQAESFAEEALETFLSLYATFTDCRASTHRAMEGYAREAVEEELFNSVRNELDILATHYNISEILIEDVEVIFDSDRIRIALAGFVDCNFQYGSDSDFKRADGVRASDSYPFTCRYEANIKTPADLVLDSLKIDNSSFFE